jgi:hypothetical protein
MLFPAPAKRPRGMQRAGWFCMTLLLALLGVLGSSASPAFALPPDPIDPDPIEEPPFTAPNNGFWWHLHSRFGGDSDGDQLIDYHWNPASATYDPAFVHPGSYTATLDGCRSAAEEDANHSTNLYTWLIDGQTISGHACRIEYSFPAEGSYPVRLTIQGQPAPFEQNIVVKDLLIVSIGDSFASGEGNPDVPAEANSFGIIRPARWEDTRCHRSAVAGPAQAAIELERADQHTSVTFLSFACAGATINTPDWERQTWPFWPNLDPQPDKPLGVGILAPYRGAELPDNYGYATSGFLASQIDQVRAAVGNRRIDALLISAGGNDVGFGIVGVQCVAHAFCWDAFTVESPSTGTFRLGTLVQRAFDRLPDKYRQLNDAIATINPARVYITEYPDLTRKDDGGFCQKILDDILPLKWVIDGEVSWAHDNVLIPLNQAVQAAAQRHNWRFVGGIASAFSGHGYCASDKWIRTAQESKVIQGPFDAAKTRGTLHPNARGHQVYKQRLAQEIAGDLFPSPPANTAPTFSVSNSAGATTSFQGTNGWLTGTGNCAGQPCSSDNVVLTVEASDPDEIRATSVSVNGTPGCQLSGVTCTAELVSATRYRWTFTINASGIYRLSFVAGDGTQQTTSLAHEVRVDLHNPTATAAITAGTAGEASWYRTPVGVTFSGADAPGGSGIRAIRYRIGQGAALEAAPGEQVLIGADGYHQITYFGQDYAGRDGPGQTLLVQIDTITPTATLVAPSSAVPEGSTFSLALTNPADAPNGDPAGPGFAYAFDCGAGYGPWSTGSSASCTALDSGVLSVRGKLKDRAGNTGEYSAVLTIAGVAPSASFSAPASAVEGSPFTLALANPSDPSSADMAAGFTYAFDCGVGFGPSGPSSTASCTPPDSGTLVAKGQIKDKDGDTRTYTANVAVGNIAPSASFSAPASAIEGSPFTIRLNNPSDPSSADMAAGFTYAFDCGAGYGAFGSSASLSCSPADNGTLAVKGKVKDKDGGFTEYSASIAVSNIAPSATFQAPASAIKGRSIGLRLADPLDAPGDMAGLQYAFDCGDGAGYGAFGASNSASCPAGSLGPRTVKGKLRDKDGALREYSAVVTVRDPLVLTISAPGDGQSFAAGSLVELTAAFTDAQVLAIHSCRISWGDQKVDDVTPIENIGSGTCAASHKYAAPGEYRIKVAVTNNYGDSATADITIVVYQPGGK